MSIKLERISDNLIREISYIVSYEVKDDNIKFVTITECKVTSDLSFAKVYFTVLDDSKKELTLKSLNNASGFIRKNLASRVDMRHVPELEFVYDTSIEYGKKIEDIIEKIHETEN